ncbi:MAG: pullulanase-type alpha-1,6-glucosidase, partial [Acidobacteriota bacterium]|nr:pullulanase-type alpha-1,6-glucosidase [Acidobacteriota bacterium]
MGQTNPAIPANHIRIHYARPDGNYSGWTVYAFGDTTEDTGGYDTGPMQAAGADDFGVYFNVGIISDASNVGIIIHNPTADGGDQKDPGPNEFVNPRSEGGEYWALSGVDALYAARPKSGQQAGTVPPGYARIHYYRPDGHYRDWAVYSFGSSEEPDNYDEGPTFATGTDSYGAFYDVKLTTAPIDLGFVVHNTATKMKDPGPDMHLAVSEHNEGWAISGDATVYLSRPSASTHILNGELAKQQAFWIDRSTVAIQPIYFESNLRYSLVYSPRADLKVTRAGSLSGTSDTFALISSGAGLTAAQMTKYPQLTRYAVFHFESEVDVGRLKQILKGQVALAAVDASGELKYLTGVQQAGVLDDLFAFDGKLGASFCEEEVRVSVWAPTAQVVKLLLFDGEADHAPEISVDMQENEGVWSASGDSSWQGKYYLYSVSVYVPSRCVVIENIVTDPYSADLALNGTRSRITDLGDPQTKPHGWDESSSPNLDEKNDLSIYELHVRDFSINDESVTTEHRGTYLAFTNPGTNGMQHLKKLAEAGLKAVHLLPTFHFGSVNEDKSTWKSPGDLSPYPRDGQEQQAAIAQIQSEDGFNWGYDPVHYLAPEGSYAVNPSERVREYREMVKGLHGAGLRVVQDQVFNHTNSSGQAGDSVLDQIVPGYYYRLDADGNVEDGSCCSDTASEHRMMEKLMIDAVVQNAREYKIDGFRFDLMGFHFVYNMQHMQQALSKLTIERDGVDGSKVYLYGEGWETGTPAHNALGPNASQVNMYGTGIGTFNDRIRDGIRGGGPFSEVRIQGFATGLFTDPSEYTNQSQASSDQQWSLLLQADWIKASLAGNMRDFTFVDRTGETVKASQVQYNGQGAGYCASPVEIVNFCSVHDNQTLFDAVQLKSASPRMDGSDSMMARARRQVTAMSLVALGQGVPFFLAGDDMLRSKDMDADSFDSSDWFNKLDFTYQSNNWGIGLPIASKNLGNWPFMQP